MLNKNTKTLRMRGRSLWMWLLPFFVCAGIWRGWEEREFCEKELAMGLDAKLAEIEGTITRREMREDGSWRLLLKEVGGKCGQDFFELRYLQVYLDADGAEPADADDLPIGAQAFLTGTLQAFDEARNPGEFDYRFYARSQKLNYRMFAKRCETCVSESFPVREQVTRFREWSGAVLERIAPQEDYGVYRAVLLGDSSRMEKELYRLYQENGVAHLLAVSGLHLSLISAAVYGLLRTCGSGYGFSATAGTVVLMLYAVLTGESSSVLRALVMSICGFAAAYLGRTYDIMSAWALALILILWESPYRMLQAGVQLSFGAILGIGWLAPNLSVGIKEGKLRALIVSLSMQLITAPILLYHYFQYPIYGILLNFLMVPFMGGVVASGAAGIVCSIISLSLGSLVLCGGHQILRWYRFCCEFAEMLPGHLIIVGRPEVWKIGVYYGILFWVSLRMRKQADGRRKRRAAVLTGILLLIFVRFPVSGMQVTFLDVGQGDGICIRSGKRSILIDGGSTDQKQLGEYRLIPFLHSQGIASLDYAVVSHGDVDHISGLEYLLETGEVQIQNLILPEPGREKAVYERLARMTENRGGQVYWLSRGARMTFSSSCWNREWEMICLSPERGQDTDDRNEHSLVFRLCYGKFGLMLTGDMTAENEQEILNTCAPSMFAGIQILKTAHHGSDTSSSERWIQNLHPRWAVISYGEGNRYGHPNPLIIERLKAEHTEVLETAKCGAIMAETNGEHVRWEIFLKEK